MNAPVLSRRHLLGATAAVGTVGLPIVAEAGIPAASPDAELLDLIERFDAARAAWDATEAPLDEAQARAVAAYPAQPGALRFRAWDLGQQLGASGRDRLPNGRWLAFYTDDDVERLRAAPPLTRWALADDSVQPPPREPDPEGEARRREIVRAHDAWTGACQRVRDEVGFTAAAEAEDAAAADWNTADDAVKLYQPRTLAGLARKAAWVADRLAAGNCDDDLGEVFARQVAAFGAAAA